MSSVQKITIKYFHQKLGRNLKLLRFGHNELNKYHYVQVSEICCRFFPFDLFFLILTQWTYTYQPHQNHIYCHFHNVNYFSASYATVFVPFLDTYSVSGYLMSPGFMEEIYNHHFYACQQTTVPRHTYVCIEIACHYTMKK